MFTGHLHIIPSLIRSYPLFQRYINGFHQLRRKTKREDHLIQITNDTPRSPTQTNFVTMGQNSYTFPEGPRHLVWNSLLIFSFSYHLVIIIMKVKRMIYTTHMDTHTQPLSLYFKRVFCEGDTKCNKISCWLLLICINKGN